MTPTDSPACGQFITTLDAHLFVIDCLPNMNAGEVANRTIPLVQYFRQRHPSTPIVLAEGTPSAPYHLFATGGQDLLEKNAALKACYDQLVKDGDKNLYYVESRDIVRWVLRPVVHFSPLLLTPTLTPTCFLRLPRRAARRRSFLIRLSTRRSLACTHPTLANTLSPCSTQSTFRSLSCRRRGHSTPAEVLQGFVDRRLGRAS